MLRMRWHNSGNHHSAGTALQSDTLVSDEYFETFRRNKPLEPEKQLIEAILEDAINVFRLYAFAASPEKKRLFREARHWIWAEDWQWPFSFCNVCEVLGLDPDYLRRGLIRWQRQQPRQRQRHNRIA